MVYNATFNNISVTLLWSVLLVEETGVTGENCWAAASHWKTSNNYSNIPNMRKLTNYLIGRFYKLMNIHVFGTYNTRFSHYTIKEALWRYCKHKSHTYSFESLVNFLIMIMCNQWLSPLKLWVWIPLMAKVYIKCRSCAYKLL
jgi:hypothetical protein